MYNYELPANISTMAQSLETKLDPHDEGFGQLSKLCPAPPVFRVQFIAILFNRIDFYISRDFRRKNQ